jgi:lysozyme family protein
LIISVCRARQAFLENLETFSTFGKGWTRRVAEVQNKALEMTNRH